MKSKLLIIVFVALLTPSIWNGQSFADCNADVNYGIALEDSELVFIGTVTRLDNYDGPQKVTFFIHNVIKGQVNTPKHILENPGKVFLEGDAVRISSIDVDYKIGKTYKVYVENGKTTQCTTKLTAPPVGYMWEPGPEDGNYYSDEKETTRQYQDANERESYRDVLDSGSIVFFTDPPKLSDDELDSVMDELLHSEMDRSVLPIASIAIDYERDTLVLWTPDLTIGDKVQEVIGDVSFVLLYEEAPVRWEHDGPEPEPELPLSLTQQQMIEEYCRTGVRHPDMMGIPQCIKEPQPSDFRESGDNISLLYAYSGLGLIGIIVGFFVVKKWKNRK